MKDPNREAIARFLEECEQKPVVLSGLKKLGEGWHGAGYLAEYTSGNEQKKTVIRTIRAENFSHDFPSDRAASLLLQDAISKNVPYHVKSIGVGAISKEGNIKKVSGNDEFVQAVELADGKSYAEDMERILNEKAEEIPEDDIRRAEKLADVLLEIHSEKMNITKDNEASAKSIYKRILRDCIGHGQMLMGVFDSYPKTDWITNKEISELVYLADKLRQELNENYIRLCRVHGDFHQGNILFENENENGNQNINENVNKKGSEKLLLLDGSRFLWGEPADDVICLGINYIWYSVKAGRPFTGSFRQLFDAFWDRYIQKSQDEKVKKIIPVFFAFRAAVVAHPIFFPHQSEKTRRTMVMVTKHLLEQKVFTPEIVEEFLKKNA